MMGGRGGSSGIRATGGGGNFPTQDLKKMLLLYQTGKCHKVAENQIWEI